MYIIHIMNFKFHIWTLKFDIWIWKLLFQLFKKIFEFENFDIFYLNSKSLFDLKFDIWIVNYFESKYYYFNLENY